MFTKMTVGKRITLGFGLILALAVALGGIAVFQLKGISALSNKLALDYAPEVEIVSSLERNSRRVMYEMRGYGFTEDAKFYEQSRPWRKTLQKRIDGADELAAGSKVLVKLAPAMILFKEKVGEYDKLVGETKEHISKLSALRTEMDASGGAYLKATNAYLANQNRQMKIEFKNKRLSGTRRLERLEKITLINDAIDITNNIRVKNFKSQALRDPEIYESGISDFDLLAPIGRRLTAITFKAKDKRSLKNIATARGRYKNAMIAFLREWKLLQEVGVQRSRIGGEVVLRAEEVSDAGIGHTKKIAREAMTKASVSSSIMIWGLLVTFLIGIFLSWILIKAITGPIIRISDGLRDSSNQVSSASSQLSGASQELSSSSDEQASSIQETSSSLEEITGMVNNNVGNAKKCVEISQGVNDSSIKGNNAVQELIASMKNILESNEKIQQLVKVIGEIGEKTAIIDEIVFQTKLLSFNASVEAERAGEHGRGFAVVAQEVGNLAQMSGKAATEISTIVKESIKNAEEITIDNRKKVESGNDIVKGTATILEEISTQSETLLKNINSILSASQDQATGIEQINTAVVQLDKATQENSSTASETASSSEELNAQARSLNDMVIELTSIVTGDSEKKSFVNERERVEIKKGSNVVRLATNNKKVAPVDPSLGNDEWEAI